MNDFLNFSLNSLNLLDNRIHDKINGNLVDNFIHELQACLEFQKSKEILKQLPKNTNLHFAKLEGNYAICFDYTSKTIYNVPKSYLNGAIPEIGDAIKLISSKDFRIDNTGIPANPNSINTLLSECNYTNLSHKLNLLPEYYKISEISTDFAICKNLNTNNLEKIPIDDVPKNAKSNDTLIYKNGKFVVKN